MPRKAGVARAGLVSQLTRKVRQLELIVALARAHAHGEPEARVIERRATPGADEFYRHYWAAHRPVVLTDVTDGWPALRWTPAMFRERFGDRTIEITTRGEQRRRMKMARFIDLVVAAGASSDLYMVSNNKTTRKTAFRPLLDEVGPPAALFQPLRPSTTSLWIGPAGTITSLHHDTTNILFCQLYGRKRIELVAPHETALLVGDLDGFYNGVDLERLPRVLVKSTVLAPGDALFIPAGWWHRVTALDVSISFSLLGFRRPNDFDWYRPGHAP